MSAVNSCRKLQKLSKRELMLLVQALLLLPLTALWMKFFGFRRLYAVMGKHSRKQDRLRPSQLGEAYATARLVQVASNRNLYRPNCLQKSLVLWWLLRRRGIESDLRIGVRKQEGRLEAHAWVEYQGCVLNDTSDVLRRFTPFTKAILPVGVETL